MLDVWTALTAWCQARAALSAAPSGGLEPRPFKRCTFMTDSNRIALVTGASRGLGLVIAGVLGARGYRVVIGGRDRDALAAAAAGLAQRAPAVVAVAGDITDATVRAELIDAARRLGGLNVLVNNASELGAIGPLASFEIPKFGRLFPVNVGAPMALTQLALPLLAGRRGLIVNITSDAAKAAYPSWGPYGATKAALELLTRTLASELHEQGVSAVLVDPGDMRTRMHQEAFPGEDISDRPLPEVTEPFWHWLFDQDPDGVRGQRFAAQQEDARWLQQA
jgi:NAD(P)-dependent dehydrogenase (short-subunit alcohol dehydrogenase family)